MTEPGGAALKTALAYHRAWTGGDFERAMSYVADDIVCLAPAGRLDGAAAFRGFMGPFTQILTSSKLIAAFGTTRPRCSCTTPVPCRSRMRPARSA
jgi:hypothetical protein